MRPPACGLPSAAPLLARGQYLNDGTHFEKNSVAAYTAGLRLGAYYEARRVTLRPNAGRARASNRGTAQCRDAMHSGVEKCRCRNGNGGCLESSRVVACFPFPRFVGWTDARGTVTITRSRIASGSSINAGKCMPAARAHFARLSCAALRSRPWSILPWSAATLRRIPFRRGSSPAPIRDAVPGPIAGPHRPFLRGSPHVGL